MYTAVMPTSVVFTDALKSLFWKKAQNLGLTKETLGTVRAFLENERYWKLFKDEIMGSNDEQPDGLAKQIAQESYGIDLNEYESGTNTLMAIMDKYLSTQLSLNECVEDGLRNAGLL